MNYMETKQSLTGKDICDIIKSCKASNVAEFIFGDLNIIFYIPPGATQPLKKLPPSNTNLNLVEQQINEEISSNMDEDITKRESDMEELILTDPVAFEELVVKEESQKLGDENA